MNVPRYTEKNNRGFTVLLAALVASLVLSLGLSIYSIASKQIILSSLGRNSQYAFYAADTAAECALYWDRRFDKFPTTTPDSISTFKCDAQDITATAVDRGSTIDTTFEFAPNEYCAQVLIQKTISTGATLIEANGFSTACSDIDDSSRALQRSVELSY